MPPTTTSNGRTHAGGIQPSASFFRPSRPNQQSQYSPQRDVFALEDIPKRDSEASEHNGNKVYNLRRGMSIDNGEDSITQEFDDDDPASSKAHEEEAIDIGRFKPSSPSSSQNHNDLSVSQARRRDRRESSNTDLSSSFNPSAPPLMTSLANTPKINPKANKPYRNHELHPSRNRFFLGGKLLTGGDSPWAFIFCFGVVLAICGLWFGTTCPWYWSNLSGGGKAIVIIGAYLAAIVITSMLTTASMDPGILPRDLDPEPPYPSSSSDGGVRAPMPRDLKVRSDVVRVKYCPTCKTYRPPRSSHCKMCDNCVDGCDHHCQWVNNCVGKRNYTTFFFLLLSATISLILIITTSALHIFLLTDREGLDFRHAIGRSDGAGSAAAFILSILVFWPVAALFSYHIRLVLLNITTIEQIRNQAHKTLVPGPAPPNPFSHGTWRRNMMAVLCRPTGFSWLDPSGTATEDKREVNPGLSGEGVPRR
ncbi:zf-DHHC-domain-containing protein [Marasmius fiardii PR-910]|nr:zf-DHHC-domain-containing protein [Marasmius fiardii PR-910]